MTPFYNSKGTIYEGGFRSPAIVRWPGVVPPGSVINGIFSGLDWLPTLAIAAGAPEDLADQLKAGMTLNGTEYKVYLDGYNQIELLKGTGDSQRSEVWYFANATLGALRLENFKYYFITQGDGAAGLTGAVQVPSWMGIVNLKIDPFERTLDWNLTPATPNEYYGHQFWRVVGVQDQVATLGQTFVDFPPQQPPASFNVQGVINQIKEQIQRSGPSN
jgi:arylsulfatase